ncbi:MAG TPA: ribosome-associated translation inhibitor RaiA [Firmicutes bacterium]|nr:ribosome-associated translation inhibitor RaiA [Candidatus Fermentithermobacillaceae bacterium]
MRVIVTGKNMDISPALRDYAEKKLKKLSKYVKRSVTAQATFSTERGRHILEVTAPLDGYLLRGEEQAADPMTCVDQVVEKLERQLEKHKTKLLKRASKTPAQDTVTEGAGTSAEKQDGNGMIVKVKRFAIKPMSPEEAVTQMDLLGHDFFVFTNAETGLVSVVYRRKDGNYGLIEPEA